MLPTMTDTLKDLESLKARGIAAFQSAATPEALEAARREFLGPKGHARRLLAAVKEVPKEQRAAYGKAANDLNKALTAAFEEAAARLADVPAGPTLDLTRPGQRRELGRAHPITRTIDEICEIFQRMGFAVVEGPEVEDEFHNFDALNIPPGHPARHPENNFYLSQVDEGGAARPVPLLLRSQTSTMQIRAMQSARPPLRVIAPGRVYRPDTVDATHHYMFHQVEGLAVAQDLHFGDLKAVLEQFAREYFGPDTRVRFRPHYFPFTEPSAEMDVDCSLLKHLKKEWLEVLGCGMVHPNVLHAVGYDPQEYTGFAFGMGVERLAMLKHGVGDIRHFTNNDLRFLRQF
jgi:phenylalanyl-tRNA synthetase alpha chain